MFVIILRVFAGTDVYRSLTPLNMECHSSDEGAFNTLIREEEKDPDSNLPPTTLNSTNAQIEDDESNEVVFRTSPPRGPLARLMKGTNGATSVETSLDMIKITLKDSSGEYTSTSLNDNTEEYNDSSNNKTTLTSILIENSRQKSPDRVHNQNSEYKNIEYIDTQYDSNSSWENEATSMDRTIVDSELPSLPTDKIAIIERPANNSSNEGELLNIELLPSSPQQNNDAEMEPISLSDIKLEENPQ